MVQHYVPQFLLRRFASERRKKHRSVFQVWVRDFKAERCYVANVSDVGAEKGFYETRQTSADQNCLESQLSKIESVAAPAIARLSASANWQTFTREDRTTLAIFLLTLYSRGPRVRHSLVEMPGRLIDHFKAVGETLAPSFQRELEEMRASDPVPDHAGVIVDAAQHYQALVDRSWWLLVPPAGKHFVCADCPVLMQNPVPSGLHSNMGLLVKGVILYLPLSPFLMLMVADSAHGLPDQHVLRLGQEEFLNLQWLAGRFTERFVYGRAEGDVVLPVGAWIGGRRDVILSPPSRR